MYNIWTVFGNYKTRRKQVQLKLFPIFLVRAFSLPPLNKYGLPSTPPFEILHPPLYSAMKRMKQGERSKRESSPRVKRKKSPGLNNRTIQSRKQGKFGSLLVSTLLDVFFLSFSPLPLCCRITRARLRFSIINQVSLQSGIITRG